MKPLKRFFLYCFYCTVAYFTKNHTAHAAYKTSIEFSKGSGTYSVYISNDAGCDSYTISTDENINNARSCDSGIYNITAYPALFCKTVTKETDDKCTLKDCDWDCEQICKEGTWGKIILESEINNPCAEDAGPACTANGNETYADTSANGWCNTCPTGSSDNEHSAGICSDGGDSFTCYDSPSLGLFYTPNKKENTCDRMCGGDGLYYDLLDKGRCLQCPSPMKECVGKYDSETRNTTVYATECNDGYYLDDGNCNDCPENSKTCDATGALSCNSSYYLVDSVCVKCPDNATCSDNGVWQCNEGFYQTNGGCETCPVGGNCSDNVLQSCNDGYYKSNTECIKCAGNAKTCDANGALSCNAGYYLENKQCLSCGNIDNSDCSDGTLKCQNGHYLSSDKKCIKCIENATCDANGNRTCNAGYAINKDGDKCLKCPENGVCENGQFKYCQPTGISEWSTYYGDINGCFQCPDNAYCVSGLPNGVCMPGYYGDISSGGAVCNRCPSGTTSRSFTVCAGGAGTGSGCISSGDESSWFINGNEILNKTKDGCGVFMYESGIGTTSGSGGEVSGVVKSRMYTDDLGTYYFEDTNGMLGTPWVSEGFNYSGFFCPIKQ